MSESRKKSFAKVYSSEMSSHTSLTDQCNSISSSPSVIHSEPLLNILYSVYLHDLVSVGSFGVGVAANYKRDRLLGNCVLQTGVIKWSVTVGPYVFTFLRFCQSPTRSSAIAEGPRDASCHLKSCQLPRNCAETTYTTSPVQIDGMKLEI